MTPAGRHVRGVLALSVLAVSTAAVLMRLAEGAHPISVGLWRTAVVGVALSPWIRPISRRDALLTALAGICLGAHFWAWFASLAMTSVLRSTVLVTLAPVWVGILEAGVLRDPPARRFWLGLAVAIPGVTLMSGLGGGGSLAGDALALLGGVFGALYFVAGRTVRQRVGIGAYGSLVCLAAALALLPAAVALDAPLAGFSPQTWAAIAAMALGPQLLGHIGVNYAMRWVRASLASALILLEPVGATLLAIAALGEVPGPLAALGGAITVAGVMLATTKQGPRDGGPAAKSAVAPDAAPAAVPAEVPGDLPGAPRGE